MPIYEYSCPKCSQVFELFHKIGDKTLQLCPHCGGKVERLISRTSFALKGDGWYKDGYGTPAPPKKETPSKTTEKKGDKTSTTTTKGNG